MYVGIIAYACIYILSSRELSFEFSTSLLSLTCWIRPWLATYGVGTWAPRFTHTHTHLTALCPGLPGWAGTRKVKPIWILPKQETVSDSGISWCKSAPRSRQTTTPVCHHSAFFTGLMPFLPPNQQRQSNNKIYKNRCTCRNKKKLEILNNGSNVTI